MRIAESELIINGDGSVFHLHLRPEELADNVILVGDPGRVDMIAEYFEEKEFRHSSREFVSVTGKYKGVRITALSTGIGTDNIDIVMNELDALANVDFETREVKPEHRTLNIIRIGTSGAIQPEIPLGAFVFSHISIGCDGLLNWYADREKIALLDIEEAFKQHTGWNRHLPDPYFVKAGEKMSDLFRDCTVPGMTVAASGFYGPQGRVLRLPLAMPDLNQSLEEFRFGEHLITNYEMESSAIYGLSKLLGHHALAVCLLINNRQAGKTYSKGKQGMQLLIEKVLNCLTK